MVLRSNITIYILQNISATTCEGNKVCCERPVIVAEPKPKSKVVCGRRKKERNTDSEHSPWQAAVLKEGKTGQYSYICSAALIDYQHFITSAKCLSG